MKFLRFFSGLFLSTTLLVVLSLPASAAEATPSYVPEACRTSAYTITPELPAAQAILQEGQRLLDLLPVSTAAATPEQKSNAFQRSYIWFRARTTFAEFAENFEFLRASECLRQDTRDLGELLTKIETNYQRALQEGTLGKDIPKNTLSRIETLQKEIHNLQKCGDKKGSIYYQKGYEKNQCKPRQKALFGLLRKRFYTTIQKLEALFDEEKWGDQLKNIGKLSPDEQAGIQATASAWLQQHSIPSLLKVPPKEKALESPASTAAQTEALRQKMEETITASIARQKQEALNSGDLDTALSDYAEAGKQKEVLLRYGAETLYDSLLVALSSAAAEYWKEQIEVARGSTQNQTKRVQELSKALKELNNRQAQNVAN